MKHAASTVGIKLGAFFYPEDGSDMFLRNVGSLSPDFTALYISSVTFLFSCFIAMLYQ
jgi:hypothetical protein